MERRPAKKRFNDYEQFALDVFDDVDLLMKVRGIGSIYEHIDERFSRLNLTDADLELARSVLMTYAVEPPDSVEIIIKGQNPFTAYSANEPRGHVWIKMEHIAESNEKMTRTYTFLVENSGGRPIDAYVDERSAVRFVAQRATLDAYEQKGLEAMLRALYTQTDDTPELLGESYA